MERLNAFKNLIIEIDSAIVVSWHGKGRPRKMAHDLSSISPLLSKISQVWFTHIRREANVFAECSA